MLGQLTYLHLGTQDTSNSSGWSTLLSDTRIYDWMGARSLMCRLNTDNKLCRVQTRYVGVAAAEVEKGFNTNELSNDSAVHETLGGILFNMCTLCQFAGCR